MDITPLFRACVKTIRTRNKALGFNVDGDILGNNRSKQTKSDFEIKVKELLTSISKMHDFLMEHRKEYININHLMYDASHMTDSERDQIDNDAQAFMLTCTEILRNLHQEIKKQTSSIQLLEHREGVIAILDSFLKMVCKVYSEQRAIRVKRAFDRQKLARLEVDNKQLNTNFTEEKSKEDKNNAIITNNDISSTFGEDLEMSSEELQIFEQENRRLYEEMNTLVDEVRQIEGKVVEISRLQEIFAEKVLQQEQDINRISDTIVGTTENIKEGNEELREAMKKNAGFRVWILFFLIVISFSLLFLDWYNP
ncbi:syntaxin-18-like [Centruroides sculpturatus]|uniref:syntaxin-18-like n=1 Tax=Centruroides sculpturatus TaxID=218467 RepID=UPI000C6D6EF1|nr:syntaxin-18-like [Centruroides sculpturatus]